MPSSKRLTILHDSEINDLYGIPSLSLEEKRVSFALNDLEQDVINSIRDRNHKCYAIALLGYFKIKPIPLNPSFKTLKEYLVFIAEEYFQKAKVPRFSVSRMQKARIYDKIYNLVNFKAWDAEQHNDSAVIHLQQVAQSWTEPRFLFDSCIEYLVRNHIAIPKYTVLQRIISQVIKHERQRITDKLKIELSRDHSITKLKRFDRATQQLYLLCYLRERAQINIERIADGFIYHVRKLREKAKVYAHEMAYKDWDGVAANVSKAAELLHLFIDKTIDDKVPFRKIKKRAHDLLEDREIKSLCLYLNKQKRAKSDYIWEYYDQQRDLLQQLIRPLFFCLTFEGSHKTLNLAAQLKTMQTDLSMHGHLRSADHNLVPANQQSYVVDEDSKVIPERYETLLYIDDASLRSYVQRALNRGEAYHQLRRAIANVNGNRFRGKNDDEISLWNECARLLTNAIIFFNSVILTRLLEYFERKGDDKKLEIIKQVSPVAWHNINLSGTYSFSFEQNMLDMDEIMRTIVQDEN